MESSEPSAGRKRQGLGRRTCLYCFHPFRIERGEAPCPKCGEAQTKAEQEKYWTLHAKWVRLQVLARIGGIAITAGLGLFLGIQVWGDGSSLFWGLGLLLLAGWFIWETGGLLTRRESALPLRILWPAIVLCIGVGPIGFSWLLGFIGGVEGGQMDWGVARLWALPWLPVLFVSLQAPKWLRARREACMRSGASD
ncbi:MAG: hypothetical protein GY930_07570 [bacterium]|nr:hypothetical protein [bacterium]